MRYDALITRLAKAQDAPTFTPHMSLASIEGRLPDLRPCFDLLSGLELKPVEIDASDAFTMSLFLRVERHPKLLEARKWMEAQPGMKASRTFDPHLSLCYGEPPADAANLDIVRSLMDAPIRFDQLRTVAIPERVETYDDVRAWKTLETYVF